MSVTVDQAHFARVVTDLGEKRAIVARSPILNTQGLKIIDRGVAIDSRLYERLSQHQLKQPLAENLGSETSVTGPTLRDAALVLCRQEPLFGAMLGTGRLGEWLAEELELVPLPEAVAFQLTMLRESRPEAWLHALRSAVAAAWLGHRQGGTRHDLRMLAAAGLVHDLGMLHLDPVLSQPEVELSGEQRRQLYSHPLVTVMLLERHHEYPRELLRAVLEHHEALDGSGYPRHATAATISPWGRILGLTEPVASMPVERLSLALRLNGRRYDVALVQAVLGLMPAVKSASPAPPAHDPAQELRAIDALLARWPAEPPPETPPGRLETLGVVRAQVAQVRRQMAEAGTSPDQLAMLGASAVDADLQAELDLIVREMAWQLRTVTRQARRRWRGSDDEPRPEWLTTWLDEAEALCARHLSV
jgi:HD domain